MRRPGNRPALSAALIVFIVGCALGCSRAEDAPGLAPRSTPDGHEDAGSDPASTPAERGRGEAQPAPVEPRDPSAFAGTVLWLDAARGVERDGERVSRWVDQSAAGNDAVPPGVLNAPVFSEDALDGGPALRFEGGEQYLVIGDGASLQLGAEDFTFAAVLSHTTPTSSAWGYGCIVSKQEPSGKFVGPSLWANSEERTGQLMGQLVYGEQRVLTDAQDLNDGRSLLAVLQRRKTSVGATLLLRVNGVEARSNLRSNVDLSARGSALHIGGTPDPRQALHGTIAELVVIEGPLSAADTGALEAYLRAKYGLGALN